MSFTKEKGHFPSDNGLYEVECFFYKPEGEPKAMIQLVHGMAEYLERYEPYIEKLTDAGFLVFGDTHIGHKGSVRTDKDLGYFGPTDGWKHMVHDEMKLTEIAKKHYPDLKCFLYGHSMGSFIARTYISWKPENFDGAIICGTAGSNPALGMGKFVTKIVKGGKRGAQPSLFLNNVMFGSYSAHIENPRTAFDWLTRDDAVVDAYIADPYCGFLFTAQGYYDLECLLEYVTRDSWYDSVPEDFPIFFIGGAEDPVGSWGKGYEEIDAKMKKKHRSDYSMKLYPGMRHELHNEIGKEEVAKDVCGWLMGHLA